MSNYRDPCEDLDQIADPLAQGETRADSDLDAAGTAYPWTVTDREGTGGDDSSLRIILPGTSAARELSSRIEFGSEAPGTYADRLVRVSLRESYMYLQQVAYNFSDTNKLAALQSSRTTPNENQLRIPVPRGRTFYDSEESVKPVSNLQDPLMYVMGKVFDSGPRDPLSDIDIYRRIDLATSEGLPDGLRLINHSSPWFTDDNDSMTEFVNDANKIRRNISGPNGLNPASVTSFIPNFKIGFAVGGPGDQPAPIRHEQGTLGEGSNKASRLNLKIVPLTFYECDETRDLDYTAGDDFLMTIFKEVEDCKFMNSNFSSPAAFDLSESDGINLVSGPSLNFIEIKSFLTKNENYTPVFDIQMAETLESPGTFKVEDTERDRTNSVYRDLLNRDPLYTHEPTWEAIEQEQIISLEVETRCPQKTLVEFYPSSRISDIKKMENSLFVENFDPNSLSQRSWIEGYTDSYVRINFQLSESATFSAPQIEHGSETISVKEIMSRSGLDTMFLSFFKNFIHSQPMATMYTHFLDSSIDPAIEGFDNDPQQRLEGLNERITSGYVPNRITDIFHKMDAFFASGGDTETGKQFYDRFLNLDEYPLVHDLDYLYMTPGHNLELNEREQEILQNLLTNMREEINAVFTFLNNALSLGLGNPEHQVFGRDFRKSANPFELPINQTLNYSEILAFRIEKRDADTDKVIKEFYLWNKTGELQDLNFYDTQVRIGKSYIYNVYAINFTVDREYSYSNLLTPNRREEGSLTRLDSEGLPNNQRILPELNFVSTVEPKYSVVETPFFSKLITPLNLPPLFPEVSVYRDSIQDNGSTNFRFDLSSRFGALREQPVAIFAEDEQIIESMRQSQEEISSPLNEEGSIQFGSDTAPIEYEMIYLDYPPESIQDFARGTRHKVSSELSSFVFTPTENSVRFLIFRTIDRAGFSNPSPVYRFSFNSYSDGNYYEFDIYEMEMETIQSRMTCRKLVSIEPSAEQMIYNLVQDTEQNPYSNFDVAEDIMSSAPALDSEIIGPGQLDSIWSRKFKLRLTSVNTSRAVDVEFSFILETEDQVPIENQILGIVEQSNLTEECQLDERHSVVTKNRESERRIEETRELAKNQNLKCDD